jgi:diguanylate cyclase (GGDEF)-like protein
VPPELAVATVIALLVGLLLIGATLAGRRTSRDGKAVADHADLARERTPVGARAATTQPASPAARDQRTPDSTLRVAWWLTVTIVLLGVGLSDSFAADQRPIFLLGGAAVATVVVLHEIFGRADRGRLLRAFEVIAAVALIGGLLVLTGFASSPFVMLFALTAVAAALAHGPQAGLAAAGLATAAFGGVLVLDPRLQTYGPEDALRLSIGLGFTWLLAFVAIAYAGHQRRAVAHALALSRTDPLTSLFNRSQLFVTLDQEVSRTRRSERGFCMLMVDVDGLKGINDTAGHMRGDDVLRALGAVIRSSIRNVDSAYRYGGDEFVVLLPETEIVGAFVVAEKIRAGAEEVGLALSASEPMTSVSIGLVSHPEDGMSAEELMTAADRAMYQAKKLGKNQISGNPRPRPALLARRSAVAEPLAASSPAESPQPAAAPVAPSQPDSPAVAIASAEPPMREPAADDGKHDIRSVAVELGPMLVDEPASHRTGEEVDDADPQEVRRRIATASRSFDPDHQIRRAMDAFLSPVGPEGDRKTPDH